VPVVSVGGTLAVCTSSCGDPEAVTSTASTLAYAMALSCSIA
jgi:hypothetical protein